MRAEDFDPLWLAGPDADTGWDVIYLDLHGEPGAPMWFGDYGEVALTAEQVRSVNLRGAVVFAVNCHLGDYDSPMLDALLAADPHVIVALWADHEILLNRLAKERFAARGALHPKSVGHRALGGGSRCHIPCRLSHLRHPIDPEQRDHLGSTRSPPACSLHRRHAHPLQACRIRRPCMRPRYRLRCHHPSQRGAAVHTACG